MAPSRGLSTLNSMNLQEATARNVVAVLDQDAELSAGIPADQLGQARQASLASVRSIAPGPWDAAFDGASVRSGFGLLVLDGLLTRDVGVEGRFGAEVLGPSDLLRPADHDATDALLPVTASWRVLADVRVAMLDP